MVISSPQYTGDWMSERMWDLSKSGTQVLGGHELCSYFLYGHATGSALGVNVCLGEGGNLTHGETVETGRDL